MYADPKMQRMATMIHVSRPFIGSVTVVTVA